MEAITELNYSSTNTYLIEGGNGTILFDTGWAGTFDFFCKELGELSKKVQDIDYIIISHFHPDHMGIAQEIAELGPVIVSFDVQQSFIHSSDDTLVRDKKSKYCPIRDEGVRVIAIDGSRQFLKELGIAGEIIHTPGHTDDSISLWLDEGVLFVGDLNPLYELELHKGTEIEKSWDKLLRLNPERIYYGHAKTWIGDAGIMNNVVMKTGDVDKGRKLIKGQKNAELHKLVSRIIRYIDKGYSVQKIEKKSGADKTLIEDVNRMYLTHQNVGVQGILDRIEIRGKY